MTNRPPSRSSNSASRVPSRAPSSSRPRSSGGGRTSTPTAIVLPMDSLAYALCGAAQAVSRVRDGSALPAALSEVAAERPQLTPQARGAMQDVAYRTLRVAGTADALVEKLTERPPPTAVHDLLVVALALMLAEDTPYAPFTVVDQAVNAASSNVDTVFAKGMVNGVLRRFLREQQALLADVRRDWVAAYNYPAWWIRRVKKAYPQAWERVLQVGNTHPPMTLRLNTAVQSQTDYLATLTAQGMTAQAVGEQAIRLDKARSVQDIPGFLEGWVSVQDAGAQQAVQLLDLQTGMRVLDACAAPGGKTGHILERAKVHVTALESEASRAGRITENIERLAPHSLGTAQVVVGDASQPEGWWDGVPFDCILADVPCSASGIVRRHPEIRWLRREADLAALQKTQQDILLALWSMLKPGGHLLYVTCSIFPEEGELQANWFVAHQKDAVRLQAPGQILPTVVTKAQADVDHDGFFYAAFEKQ